jgi:hypothetical protein
MQKLDIKVTEEQAHWIRYSRWCYKKMKKKKKKTLVKVEDFKLHRWQYSAG